jgi:altronate dehydratase small subunit
MAADALIIKGQDNVATALRDIRSQEEVRVTVGTNEKAMTVREPIPYGHKFAIRDIAKGEKIIKYGEVMGRATRFIGSGFHAHIQNIESLRGRGDWAGEAE